MSEQSKPINIIGAGLAGSLLSVFLAKKGHKVHVYERRPDMRKAKISAGRSINLALSTRGIHALSQVGLIDEIMPIAIPMYGRMMHDTEGNLNFQPYSKDEKECIYSVSRGELNMKLMSLAESYENVEFFFDQRCEGVDLDAGSILMQAEGGEIKALEAETNIACDGAFSAVRYTVQKTARFNLSQSHLAHGYKELTIPPTADGGFRMEKNALHIWPRGSYMMIALPNEDGSFTCTLFFPFEGENSFASLDTEEKVLAFFKEQFPDAIPLMPTLLEDYFTNPTSSLVTIRCYPWALEDKLAILGDASHAIVPFFGQGMNAAFEDCTVLDACIEAHGPNWRDIFQAFQTQRKPDADAIADMALENFIEMRDKVADEQFLFRKSVEHELERRFPDQYISRYELVSFSRIPYAEAYRLGEENQKILDELTEGISSIDEIDFDKAEKLIQERLPS